MAIADQIKRLQNAQLKIKNNFKRLDIKPSDFGLTGSVNAQKMDGLAEMTNPKQLIRILIARTASAQRLFQNSDETIQEILEPSFTANCVNFRETFVGSTWLMEVDTSKGEEFLSTFWGCRTIENFPNISTQNAQSLSYTYSNCDNAKSVPAIDFINCGNAWGTFNKCCLLTKVEFYNWGPLAVNHGSICQDCYSLKAFVIRSFSSKREFKVNNLKNCYHFHGTKDATYNPTGAKDGYIYVPKAYVNELKAATNWSVFASQIRALEDYTTDGTTTGPLNTTKMGL